MLGPDGACRGIITGMRYMGMIHRVEQVMTRAEDYDFLLALYRTEVPRSEAEGLLVQ